MISYQIKQIFAANDNGENIGSLCLKETGKRPFLSMPHFASENLTAYRFSRREDDYCIECSEDGVRFKQMRICHMHQGGGKIRFGIYACSPEDSSFKAVFSELKLTECMWKAHDGQQPDE